MYRRILVPLDGSPLAEAALPHALALAKQFSASAVLLQVVTPVTVAATVDPLSSSGTEAAIAMEVAEASERDARRYLDEIARRPELKVVSVETEVVKGIPAREIIQRAKAGDVDVIVMSTHGRSGLGRLVFGSVADQVLREAGLPILLIRPKEHSQKTAAEKRTA